MARREELALGRQLSRELRVVLAEVYAHEGELAYPRDWYALALLAAERIAPAVLKTAGLPPTDDDLVTSVSRLLVTAWGNALIAMNRGVIEEFHRARIGLETGTPPAGS